jgi:hypothetical protein
VPAPRKPDARQELLATLGKKQHITALADDPGDKAQPLCVLPWSLVPDQFDIQLMTPVLQKGASITVRRKPTGDNVTRWHCEATVPGENGEENPKPFTIGYLELDTSDPWQPRLQFTPAKQKENGHADAYAALRCCRLCLSLNGQSIATCQMRTVQTMGRLLMSLPEGENERRLSEVALPRLLNQPRLDFDPKQCLGNDLTLQIKPHATNQTVIVEAKNKPITKATVNFRNGSFTLTKSIWASETRLGKPYGSMGKRDKENDHGEKTRKLNEYDGELKKHEARKAALEKTPSKDRKANEQKELADLNKKLIPETSRKQVRQKGFVDALTEELDRISDVEVVNAARFLLDEWTVFADTTFPDGGKPMPEGDPALESRVVLVKGSAKDPPLEFVSPPPAKSPDLPESDTP